MPVFTFRVTLLAISITIALIGAIFIWSFLDESLYWHRHRDRDLFAAASKLSVAVQQMPTSDDAQHESEARRSRILAKLMQRVSAECARLGKPVRETRLDGNNIVFFGVPDEVLVIVDDTGRIAVNRSLIVRPLSEVPSWIELLPGSE